MCFATLVDQEGQVFDTVLFPPVAAQYSFRGKGYLSFLWEGGKRVRVFEHRGDKNAKAGLCPGSTLCGYEDECQGFWGVEKQ